MNERIRQLAVQAGLNWKVQPLHFTNTSNPVDFPISVNRDLEKFAELIVMECVTLADKEAERFSNLNQEYCAMAMDNYRELVRKHFGVE